MTDSDSELLARYGRGKDEDAFAELVKRHVGLVYSAALRQVQAVGLAEEVTQSVFTALARQATHFRPEVILPAWLHTVTRRTALNVVRGEYRRQSRERLASELQAMNTNPTEWTSIEPLLDEAMLALPELDRAALLLRYFENKSLREVGLALGSSENAVQKRMTRSLERLRAHFAQNGLTVGAGALVALLSANAVQAVPVALTASIVSTAGALGATSFSTSTTLAAAKVITMTTIQKSILAACVTAAVSIGIYEADQASRWRERARKIEAQQAPLEERLSQLQQTVDSTAQASATALNRPAPHLPAPRFQPSGSQTTADLFSTTNLYALSTNQLKLRKEQLEAYLETNHRSASSLLAAFRTTGDPELLQEAMQSFPTNAQVSFEAALRKDISPEERRQWLDLLRSNDPGNALPDYLSASDHFKAGQTDAAVRDLMSAAGKSRFADYTLDRLQDDEDAYRGADYPAAQAKVVATSQLTLPQLVAINGLNRNLQDLANSYRQAGDEASRQATLQLALGLGRRYDDGGPGQNLVGQLVGLSIERDALKGMDPNAIYDVSGQTVQQRLDSLIQQRTNIRQLANQAEPLWPTLSEQDWMSYCNRTTAFGEETALRWLVGKFAAK